MEYRVETILSDTSLVEAFEIRRIVFVEEQQVPLEEEYDDFEMSSIHLICRDNADRALGTCRWRFTDKGIKLERFCVLKSQRGQGIGAALVKACLESIQSHPEAKGKIMYLHAQIDAIPLYEKFGFRKVGESFEECNILHYTMERSM